MGNEKLAKDILKSVGGEANVINLVHCATRLRFKLKDKNLANKNKTEGIDGVITVVESGGQYQVVIGNNVGEVYKEIGKISKVTGDDNRKRNEKSDDKFLNRAIDMISSIFTPVLPALIAAGMLKGVLMISTLLGMNTESGIYLILDATSDAVFYFLPILLAVTSARKFGANQFLAIMVAGALIHPNIVELVQGEAQIDFLGIPVILMSYTSTVLPIIFSTYFLSIIEGFFNRVIHPVAKNVLTPLFSVIIVVPFSFLLIGPVTTYLSEFLGNGYEFLYGLSPIIAGFILGAAWQILVVFGLHWGIVPIGWNNLALYGRNTITGMNAPSNFAQAGAAFGVFLRAKNRKVKQVSLTAGVTALFSITEPAVYGVTLRYKKPFYIAVLFGGIAGAIGGAAGAGVNSASGPVGILQIPLFIGQGFVGFIIAILVAFFGTLIATYLFGYDKKYDIEEEGNLSNESTNVDTVQNEVIVSPLNGEALELQQVSDELFANEALGKGVAIIPNDGNLYAPVDGEITIAFPTGHAVGITSVNGAEILMHIGFNTVELEGKNFELKVEQGQKVRQGELLVQFNLEKIKSEGYDITTPVVITNSNEYNVNSNSISKSIKSGDELIELEIR